jgi:hypothetical protein
VFEKLTGYEGSSKVWLRSDDDGEAFTICCDHKYELGQKDYDYEYLPDTSATMIYIAMIHLMLRQLTSNFLAIVS